MDHTSSFEKIVRGALLALVVVFFMFPIVWILLMSVQTNETILSIPPSLVFTPTFDNYVALITGEMKTAAGSLKINFMQNLGNSVLLSSLSVIVALILGVPAAYAFARFKFRLGEDIAFTLLSFRFAPPLLVLLPLSLYFKSLGLTNTYIGLIWVYQLICLPLILWIVRGYFEDLSARYRARPSHRRQFVVPDLPENRGTAGLTGYRRRRPARLHLRLEQFRVRAGARLRRQAAGDSRCARIRHRLRHPVRPDRVGDRRLGDPDLHPRHVRAALSGRGPVARSRQGMSQLALKSLTKAFGSHKVLKGLDLAARPGEIVVMFGGSGSGKSILLRLIAGVEEATGGSIEIAGRDMTGVAPEHRNVGMAFQNFALFPHMSAAANIGSPLVARKAAAPAVEAGVNRVAKLLKIDHVLDHAPRELSNGQKQRTSLARALVAEPRILLLDDPLRNVDAKLGFEMRLELPVLLREAGTTVLYVTQDYKEAMALADRIAVLVAGEFIQVATPEDIYLRPATVGVARLFGDPVINLVEAPIEASGGGVVAQVGGGRVALDGGNASAAGTSVTVGIRPEAVIIGAAGSSGLDAEVMAVTPLNERTVLLLKSANGWECLASLPSTATSLPAAGSRVGLAFAAEGTHLFDTATGKRFNG